MFQSISWFQYALFVGVAFCLYYLGLFVWMIKERFGKNWQSQKDPAGSVIKRIWSPKGVKAPVEASEANNSAAPASSSPRSIGKRQGGAEEAATHLMVHDLLDEVQALIEGMKEDPSKDELLNSLRKIVHKYPAVIDSGFRPNISSMIRVHSEKECAILLSDEEVNRLWH